MQSFSQRDGRWAPAKMGKSQLTIGRYGCTTTCIADLSTYFGDNLDPLQVSQKIQYTPGGLILWSSCKFSHFVFERREYGRHDEKIMQAMHDPAKAVILEVAHATHWVVAIGGGPTYKIADPWFGDRNTMARYENNITGAAYFKTT